MCVGCNFVDHFFAEFCLVTSLITYVWLEKVAQLHMATHSSRNTSLSKILHNNAFSTSPMLVTATSPCFILHLILLCLPTFNHSTSFFNSCSCPQFFTFFFWLYKYMCYSLLRNISFLSIFHLYNVSLSIPFLHFSYKKNLNVFKKKKKICLQNCLLNYHLICINKNNDNLPIKFW